MRQCTSLGQIGWEIYKRSMETQTFKNISCCPHCSSVIDQSSETIQCDSCLKQFPIIQGIPVVANAPISATDSLTAEQVSMMLEQVEEHGWAQGVRALLLQLPEPKGQAAHTEFIDPRGVLTAMMVGGPHHISVLCLGCTEGAVPFALAQRFPHVTIYDESLGRLKILERRSVLEQYQNMQFVCGGDAAYLPFSANRFDLVLCDARAFPNLRLKDSSMWREIERVLHTGGSLMVGVRNGQDLRWLFTKDREALQSGVLKPRFLQKMLGKSGLKCLHWYGVLPDIRMPEVLFDLNKKRFSRTTSASPRMRERLKSFCLHNRFFVPAFGVVAKKNACDKADMAGCEGQQSFVEGILDSVENTLQSGSTANSPLEPRRIAVRKSGRLVITASYAGKSGASVIIKVPCTSWLMQNEERNTNALRLLHANDAISEEVKRLIPHHLAKGSFGGQSYFVENKLDGIKASGSSFIGPYANILLRLHKATARVVTFGDHEFSALEDALLSVRMATKCADYDKVWNRIQQFLANELIGKQIPLVWSHGDTGSSLLQDHNGRPSGIMDWETFDKNGLPLYDWILLCVSRHKSGWRSLGSALTGEENLLFEKLPLADYLKTLNLDRQLIPALAVSAWTQYVAHRFNKRGCDPKWLRRTVFSVLELCRELL